MRDVLLVADGEPARKVRRRLSRIGVECASLKDAIEQACLTAEQ